MTVYKKNADGNRIKEIKDVLTLNIEDADITHESYQYGGNKPFIDKDFLNFLNKREPGSSDVENSVSEISIPIVKTVRLGKR